MPKTIGPCAKIFKCRAQNECRVNAPVNIPSSFLTVGRSNLLFSEFILINKAKKDSSLCLLEELSRNYDGRIRIEVTRTPSIRHVNYIVVAR